MQSIYQEMQANGRAAIGRATAYQTGRVTRANQVEVGVVVYYFSPGLPEMQTTGSARSWPSCGRGPTGWWASQAKAWPLSSPWATGLRATGN